MVSKEGQTCGEKMKLEEETKREEHLKRGGKVKIHYDVENEETGVA